MNFVWVGPITQTRPEVFPPFFGRCRTIRSLKLVFLLGVRLVRNCSGARRLKIFLLPEFENKHDLQQIAVIRSAASGFVEQPAQG